MATTTGFLVFGLFLMCVAFVAIAVVLFTANRVEGSDPDDDDNDEEPPEDDGPSA